MDLLFFCSLMFWYSYDESKRIQIRFEKGTISVFLMVVVRMCLMDLFLLSCCFSEPFIHRFTKEFACKLAMDLLFFLDGHDFSCQILMLQVFVIATIINNYSCNWPWSVCYETLRGMDDNRNISETHTSTHTRGINEIDLNCVVVCVLDVFL